MLIAFFLFALLLVAVLISQYFHRQLGTKQIPLDLFLIVLGLFNTLLCISLLYKLSQNIKNVLAQNLKLNLDTIALKQNIVELKNLASTLHEAQLLDIPITETCSCPLVPILLCAVGVIISGIQIASVFNSGTLVILYTSKSWYYPILSYCYPLNELHLAKLTFTDDHGNTYLVTPDLIKDTADILIQPKYADSFTTLAKFLSTFIF